MAFFGFLTTLFGVGCKPKAAVLPPPPPEAEAMRGLRSMMLTTPASKLEIHPSEQFPKVFGVVMDMPISGGHTATVVSMCDGHASLYTTSTFGVLGGIGHESIRKASMDFVALAQSFFDEAAIVAEFPYPVAGHVRFYLIGFEGVRVIDSEIAAVERQDGRHASLWLAGQRVLAELRLIAEKK